MHDKSLYSAAFGNKKVISYAGLFFVVFVWGIAPMLTLYLYRYYSPSVRTFFAEVILLLVYLLVSKNHLKELNGTYLKAGIPTGFFLALANISQKLGLPYTTPARCAFLENLSCVIVPVAMYVLVRKKPGIKTITASFLCLAGVIVLNGASFGEGAGWGIGEILCALAGILYGFNIAGTGAFAKNLYAPLYLAVQAAVGVIVSFVFVLVLSFVTVTSDLGIRVPVEEMHASFQPEHVLFLILVTVISSALCWTIRTNAMKHVDASVVSVIMPFSAVITGVVSVIFGIDTLSFNLVAGGLLGVAAVIISGADDRQTGTAASMEKSKEQ